jgi:hypothetical protein
MLRKSLIAVAAVAALGVSSSVAMAAGHGVGGARGGGFTAHAGSMGVGHSSFGRSTAMASPGARSMMMRPAMASTMGQTRSMMRRPAMASTMGQNWTRGGQNWTRGGQNWANWDHRHHHHRHHGFFPFAVGVGFGLGLGYDYGYDSCWVWDGWEWVYACGYPYGPYGYYGY